MISGGQQDGAYKAGLEIVLDEGWKTYWKVPGDSGIPPQLDLSASQNVQKTIIRWPAPGRFDVGNSQILGYQDAIIFPILVKPEDASGDVTLNLTASVGLCSDLCVPLTADLTLDIPKGGARDLASEMLIDRDLALAPLNASETFGIASLEHEKHDGRPDRLVITAHIPDGYGDKDLFVEGPDDWLLPLTKLLGPDPKEGETFELILDGLPKNGQSKGVELTFTLTNGDEAVEQLIKLEK